jgi:hypothetical protein
MNEKRPLFKILQGVGIALSLIIVLFFCIYSIAWFTITKKIELAVGSLWSNPTFEMTGTKPGYTGYPMIPSTSFSGILKHDSGLMFKTDLMTLNGFPAPNQIQMLETKTGFTIAANFLERELKAEYAYLQFRTPKYFPANTEKQNMLNWQKATEPIEVQKIIIKAGHLAADGSGTIGFDENLQLTANIEARVTGIEAMFTELEKEQGEKTIAVARSFYNMLSKTNEVTGEKYFDTTLKIQNNALFFGPMRLTSLPKIDWEDAQ